VPYLDSKKNNECTRKWYHEHRDQNLAQQRIFREKNPFYQKRRKAILKYPGELTIATIQDVYESNIKKFGTLTCIYCMAPISFGNDSLEHIIPRKKGGTNGILNLAVACVQCNRKKRDHTVEEFLINRTTPRPEKDNTRP